jgi:hypothetical protein
VTLRPWRQLTGDVDLVNGILDSSYRQFMAAVSSEREVFFKAWNLLRSQRLDSRNAECCQRDESTGTRSRCPWESVKKG